MRAITKQGNGSLHLNKFHAHPPQTAKQAENRWGARRFRPCKGETQASLLEEQFHLCCYSEIRADLLGLGYHIEHIQPKSAYPQRTFDYQNLAASALDSENDLKSFNVQSQEVFGGHAKLSKYDTNLFISCHQPDCARFFAYLSDGRVVPALNLQAAERTKAEYTIETLNLNSPFLVNLRSHWWSELEDLFVQHQQDQWSIDHLAAIDLVPTRNKLSPFFSLTRQFFGSVSERGLSQYAPGLI